MYIMGIDVTAADATAEFSVGSLGAIIDNQDNRLPKVFVYVQATAAITAKQAVVVGVDDTAAPSGASALVGARLAVAPCDIGSGEFGWVQVYGRVSDVPVTGTVAAGDPVSTSATAGALGDSIAGTTLRPVYGATFGTAASSLAVVYLNWPAVGAAFAS